MQIGPRPANLPVGSTWMAPGLRTMRIKDRFAKISRQPTQVRWGTCFRRTVFADACIRVHLISLIVS